MTDKYDSNGDGSYNENFKRKSTEKSQEGAEAEAEGENEDSRNSQKAEQYIRELMAEKILMDQNKLPIASRLIDSEITKVQQMGRPTPKEIKFVDIYREKPIKVAVKVLVPVKEHPKFNFVGKLLGPKGNSLRRLQEETMCKMAILGRGSMKDRAKEEELRISLDPKYAHLSDDLHVEISALGGPPGEAHARVAFALAELRKYLIPDSNDIIRQQQMREMEIIQGASAETEVPIKRSILASSRPSVPMRTATRVPVFSPRSVMPAKTKIMSILDRARAAMEETYNYEDGLYEAPAYEPPVFRPTPPLSKSKFYSYEYEPEYYKESSSSYGDSAASSTHWIKPRQSSTSSSHSRHPSESRYRPAPYSRPSK